MNKAQQPRVAIVHDWMLLGGAEKVVEQLLQMYPDAPLYTSCISPDWQEKLKDRTVITGYLQGKLFQKIRKFTPFLRQKWFEKLDFSDYNIVISSSGAEAKGIKVPEGVLHINYCHAPTHYYWSRYDEYIQNPGFGPLNFIAKIGLRLLVRPMRKWDLAAAQRPHVIIANSSHIAAGVKKYYGRSAVVIHPPVDVVRFINTAKYTDRTGYIVAGRQTPYKRFDLAIQAANALSLPLTVLGNGPDHARLVSLAGPSVTFKTNVSDAEMVSAFQTAKGFIFAGLDDFGITPVEAMAAGCPVIAYKAGGALDYVIQDETGVFFAEQKVAALTNAVKTFEEKKFREEIVVKKAVSFGPERFRVQMRELVQNEFAKFQKH
jgi:glycosyltransferase involved in cell wall biosynthesis